MFLFVEDLVSQTDDFTFVGVLFDIDRDEIVLPGEVVSPINPPDGDVFQTRTPMKVDQKHEYASTRPPLVQVGKKDHWVVKTPWSIADKDMKVKLEGK